MLLNLEGKKGLVVGIANDKSIAYGCARAFRQAGAEIGVTYGHEKSQIYVGPLAEALEAGFIMPLDVTNDQQMDAVFQAVQEKWGSLDFLLHSIAYADRLDLHGRVTDSSKDGFLKAMDISCHSFIRMAKRAEAVMKNGGSLLTVSYIGSNKVIDHYSIMGPVKAALESTVRYLAAELGEKDIRVNALSPGAIATRAASGILDFDNLLKASLAKTPLKRLVEVGDVGNMAAFLVSDMAKNITGGIHVIDAGYDIMG